MSERVFKSVREWREAMFPADVKRERAAAETPQEAGKRLAEEALRRGTSDPHAPSNISKRAKRLGPDLQKAKPKTRRIK